MFSKGFTEIVLDSLWGFAVVVEHYEIMAILSCKADITKAVAERIPHFENSRAVHFDLSHKNILFSIQY